MIGRVIIFGVEGCERRSLHDAHVLVHRGTAQWGAYRHVPAPETLAPAAEAAWVGWELVAGMDVRPRDADSRRRIHDAMTDAWLSGPIHQDVTVHASAADALDAPTPPGVLAEREAIAMRCEVVAEGLAKLAVDHPDLADLHPADALRDLAGWIRRRGDR